MSTYGDIDEHIERLRNGGTLTENEVKVLCEKVRCGRMAILRGGHGLCFACKWLIP